jgi:hypothetical protein
MQVDSQVRCVACSRPLVTQPGSAVQKGGSLHLHLMEITHSSTSTAIGGGGGAGAAVVAGGVQVWGPKPYIPGMSPNAAIAAAPSSSEEQQTGGTMSDLSEKQILENSNVTGTVIFSNKLAFHRICYLRMHC